MVSAASIYDHKQMIVLIEAICIYANSFYVGVWAKVAVRPISVLLITMFPSRNKYTPGVGGVRSVIEIGVVL